MSRQKGFRDVTASSLAGLKRFASLRRCCFLTSWLRPGVRDVADLCFSFWLTATRFYSRMLERPTRVLLLSDERGWPRVSRASTYASECHYFLISVTGWLIIMASSETQGTLNLLKNRLCNEKLLSRRDHNESRCCAVCCRATGGEWYQSWINYKRTNCTFVW